jgi:hypothetical protein
MSTPDPRIERFLTELINDGRSSPKRWYEFSQFLNGRGLPGQPAAPVPLILAASGESNASKHRRLSEQLYWALENGCLDDVLRYLRDIPVDDWNSCSRDNWYRENYPC